MSALTAQTTAGNNATIGKKRIAVGCMTKRPVGALSPTNRPVGAMSKTKRQFIGSELGAKRQKNKKKIK